MPAEDQSREMLRWLLAIGLPETVYLACSHTALDAVPPGALGVKVSGCSCDESLALPAQLLACGIDQVQVIECDLDPEAGATQLAAWRAVLPDVTGASALPRPRWWRRTAGGPVFCLGSRAFSRRSAFGLRPERDLPFDLDADEESRGVAALRLLHKQGRAALQANESPAPLGATSPGAVGVAIELSARGCTACGVCVRACPHQALELATTAGISVLSHHADLCRGDQACVGYCPVGALSAVSALSLVDLVSRETGELARVPTLVCSRCGVRHPATEGQLCPACRFRSDNAFGSMIPRRARSH
jgi:ferredoxin